jgi:hypothetical protein
VVFWFALSQINFLDSRFHGNDERFAAVLGSRENHS